MYELLLIATGIVIVAGMFFAFDGSRDIFHPLIFLGPMLFLLYCWMPFQLSSGGGLDIFFDRDELIHVQLLYGAGVLAMVCGTLSVGVKRYRFQQKTLTPLDPLTANRLLACATVIGVAGLVCWGITIINVGGFVNAFSSSYSGGWDDNGYVRDGAMMLLVGALLGVTVLARGGPRLLCALVTIGCALPWSASALLMGRRGPTFGLVVILLVGWYMAGGRRPPVIAMGVSGVLLGWLVLFLVSNRQNIFLGSDKEMTTEVSEVVDKPQSGNEYIYGSGTVLSAEKRDHYYWMRRYLAQVFVRPVPSSIWPTKYEDFGVPELLYNAGTGEGFGDTLGWTGATGSAPGIIADLWLEVWWFAVLLMGLIGWCHGFVWSRAVTLGGVWTSLYVVLIALSIYLVMQTIEAVLFRVMELSLPCWLAWRWSSQRKAPARRAAAFTQHFDIPQSDLEVAKHA